MKPLHVFLLAAGAALAGGLAVKMTQPPRARVAASVASPVDQPGSPPAAVSDPVVVSAPVAKPTPIPESPAPVPTSAAAPAPVYSEPAKPVIRKNKPIQTAKAKPTQWAPVRYEAAAKATPPKPDPFQPLTTPEPPNPQVPIPQAAIPQITIPQITAPSPVPPAEAVEQNAPTSALPVLPPREATLRTGMTVAIRLDESLSSERSMAGDTFQASLDEPLVVDGLVIAEKGARVSGRIVDSQKAGRVGGTSLLRLGLTTLATADGQRVAISTDPWTKQGDTSHLEDAGKIGAGAALGAIIGAIAGGGKGAAIGAGVGGGAGAGTAMATHGKPVNVPSETVIRFRLASKVTITERQLARQ